MSCKLGLAVLIALPLCAQWLKVPDKSIPRTKDGKPDVSAPAPRQSDGRVDLEGIWIAPGPKYLQNLAADLKPEQVPMQPWAAALTKDRMTGAHAGEESDANCLPQGVPKINVTPVPFKIVEEPGEVIILYEAFGIYRQIFTDGRALPKDPNPAWMGYSVGKWEKDSLVVTTSGFNGKAWLDQAGHPQTDDAVVTERFRRPDFGHLTIEVTINDPKAYTRPWTVTEGMNFLADTELLEFICNENNRDIPHLPH
ncbi:MAG TPA: hypothetical protein VFW44_18455 [Bryobacteraceae bacterium]|nr:hypothetical protein [Bryobacteraceae bacterium]